MKPHDPLWESPPPAAPCPFGHAWVRYISRGFRECYVCNAAERLWADFGLGVKPSPAPPDPSPAQE